MCKPRVFALLAPAEIVSLIVGSHADGDKVTLSPASYHSESPGFFMPIVSTWHDTCYTDSTLKGEPMTPAEFKAIYPSFATVSDAEIQRQIDLFGRLYQGNYGDITDYLLGLFVAHQATVSSSASAAPVQSTGSRSVGDVSVSLNQSSNAASAGDFAGTKYGLEFSRLMRMFGMGPVMSGAYSGS